MKKYDDTLFQIGDVTKIIGTTRKTLLVYENMGLLTPAVKDAESGYRYYSADNIMQIRSIRSLQKLGLSLKEVAAYYYDTENIETYLKNLMELRATLDKNIQMLQIRAAKKGDLTVHSTTLPRQVCFCREYECTDVLAAAKKLRETYITAVHTGKSTSQKRMFTIRKTSENAMLNLVCCIPMEESFDGPERVEFPETPALCIYYRGAYEGISNVFMELNKHLKNNNIVAAGPFRSIYLEGPPNRGTNTEDYITQVAVQIKL